MSFLAPLYLLGGLAVTLPVVLHLIRRTPRGRQIFSSLIFLSPSPPRITRRSRIEHWLLLFLRAAVIVLLALAFARPFLRASASLLVDRGPGRQIVILVDTSASMRRGELLSQARRQVERVLADLGGNDQVALYQFDATVRPVVEFPEPTVDPATHRAMVRRRLRELTPTWHATDLGRALTLVADSLAAERRERGDDQPCQIVVVSDLQQGADLAALQGYDWPSEVLVTVAPLDVRANTNATVRLLSHTAEPDLRARISNAADSAGEEFRIGWRGPQGEMLDPVSVYVPAGQARVVKIPERPGEADRLQLSGDDVDFDNDYFVLPMSQRKFEVVFLGDDAVDDARGVRYFLERVWLETPRRLVTIREPAEQQPLQPAPDRQLDLVVSVGVRETDREPLQAYLQSGGVALLLAADAESRRQLAEFLPGVEEPPAEALTEAGKSAASPRASFALLSELDFTHPVFATFADPRFGDFTKVRFWNHQRFGVRDEARAHVLARFDDRSPALWEQPIGQGRVYVFASTWRPGDSQLALSSKFVPLLSSLLNQATGVRTDAPRPHLVGDPISLADFTDSSSVLVTAPDGTESMVSSRAKVFERTDAPGIYEIKNKSQSQTLAVNLAIAESDTEPIPVDRLEQLGVRTGNLPIATEIADRQRQLRDIELESRQKLWQWLIVGALVLLGVETVVAGRAAQKQEALREAI